ncbi:MAG: hypothetical protein V6Z86_04650 [Hyphomicrobiales bacterium]
MKELEVALKRDMKEMESRIAVNILKWMFTALLGQTAVIVGLVKLFDFH